VVTSTMQIGDIEAGFARLNMNVTGRVVHVPLLNAKVLGSNVEGQATIDLDNPNGMTAVVAITDVDPKEVSKLIAPMRAFTGSFDMNVVIAPSPDPHALEPLALDMTLNSRNVFFQQTAPPPPDAATQPATSPTTESATRPGTSPSEITAASFAGPA